MHLLWRIAGLHPKDERVSFIFFWLLGLLPSLGATALCWGSWSPGRQVAVAADDTLAEELAALKASLKGLADDA